MRVAGVAVNFESYSESRVRLINNYIEESLERFQKKVSQQFSPLIAAMRYSLDGGGKRLRPLLVIASAESLGIHAENVLPAACAVEYLHTYSLIHDDLPALDDDDTRRGKPSSHKQFGEAVAILAGDALLTEAFGQMLSLQTVGNFKPNHVLSAIELLAQHGGVAGMVGGQLLDVTIDANNCSLPELEFIHIHKTGAIILASVLLPTRLIPMEEAKVQRLRHFGGAIGLAFQISDDLLDAKPMSRYARGPRRKPKPSYLKLMDPKEVREKLNALVDTAKESIMILGDRAKPLIDVAEFIRTRKN